MSIYDKVQLIDDIRKDALILMQSRDIPYEEAYEICRENLVNSTKVTEFEAQPLSVEIGDIIPSKINQESSSKTLEEIIYNTLKDTINMEEYTSEQLEEYYIAFKMGVDINKFIRKEWNPAQIRFLSIMLASGLDIKDYVNDINFDAEKAFADRYAEEIVKEKQLKLSTD